MLFDLFECGCLPMYDSVNGILTAVGKCAVDAICG